MAQNVLEGLGDQGRQRHGRKKMASLARWAWELYGQRLISLSLGRGAEILYSLAVAHARRSGLASQYPLSNFALLTEARRTLGLFQHHDAITGTAKEAVVADYGVRWEPSPPGRILS